MIRRILLYLRKKNKELKLWSKDHFVNLSVFNFIIFMLILLRSAGYFHPFFPLSVNAVIFITLICAVIILKLRNRGLFFVAGSFWIFASLMKILKVDVWAERTAIYAYQSLVLGVTLFVIESFFESIRKKT